MPKRNKVKKTNIGGEEVKTTPFALKLWNMVEDPQTNDLISWNPTGESFLIRNHSRFCSELLATNYKHSNLSSFIRILNIYGFHKISSRDSGGLIFDHKRDEMEFAHPYFQRKHPELLEHVTRRANDRKKPSQENVLDFSAPASGSRFNPETARNYLDTLKTFLKTKFDRVNEECLALQAEYRELMEMFTAQQKTLHNLMKLSGMELPALANLPSDDTEDSVSSPLKKVKVENVSDLEEEGEDDESFKCDESFGRAFDTPDISNESFILNSPDSNSSDDFAHKEFLDENEEFSFEQHSSPSKSSTIIMPSDFTNISQKPQRRPLIISKHITATEISKPTIKIEKTS